MVMRMGMILVFVPYALALAMPTDASFSPACDVSGTYSCAASNGIPGPEEGGPYVVREQQSILEIENQTSYTFVQRLIPGSGWEETEDILSVCAFNLWSEPVNPTAICADVTSEAITEYTFSDDCSTLHGVTFRSLGSAPSAVGSNTPFAGSTVCHRTDAGAVEGLAPIEEAPLEFCDVDGVWDCKVKLRFGLGQGAVTDEFTLYNTQVGRLRVRQTWGEIMVTSTHQMHPRRRQRRARIMWG